MFIVQIPADRMDVQVETENRNATAVAAYQMEVETAALVCS